MADANPTGNNFNWDNVPVGRENAVQVSPGHWVFKKTPEYRAYFKLLTMEERKQEIFLKTGINNGREPAVYKGGSRN